MYKRWGCVGASDIAKTHFIEAIRLSGGSVAWVQSSNLDYAKQYSLSLDIPKYSNNITDLLQDDTVDCVYISSTNEKHASQAILALQAGKNVLCEKPIAMKVKDAGRMVACAKELGLVLGTNHHLRGSPSHRAIKSLLEQGVIGDVLSARVFHASCLPERLRTWRLTDKEAGGVILDILVHDADIVRYHLGQDVVSVCAMNAHTIGSKGNDEIMSIWQMEDGITVQAHESFTHEYAPKGIEFHGTKGSIVARNVLSQDPVGEIILSTATGNQTIDFPKENSYVNILHDFYKAISTKSKPTADGLDGLKSLAIALAVKNSMNKGVVEKPNYLIVQS